MGKGNSLRLAVTDIPTANARACGNPRSRLRFLSLSIYICCTASAVHNFIIRFPDERYSGSYLLTTARRCSKKSLDIRASAGITRESDFSERGLNNYAQGQSLNALGRADVTSIGDVLFDLFVRYWIEEQTEW
ncbi:hypothetical protein PoB_003724600 [Plakobranchus ocellatus]|uniref:Uncharacterized protein n=1 Tax=Plakobranchus ocellatus TaxID=259542 RepID=A0AAV4AW29_9GAST|nr:hypothetical protein PoB_003724600 [Plakobranchus ocellatus]